MMKGRSIIDAIEGGTAKWAKQRKAEERAASARANRRYVMTRVRSINQKEASEQILPDAWAKASGDGEYPASARQIYYAARGPLQDMTGKPVKYNYFSQTLLPDFIEEHMKTWDVVYDARGTYFEPHGGRPVPIGTLQVRKYLAGVDTEDPDEIPKIKLSRRFPTSGPRNRFGAILFVEKEGFKPLLDAARIARRFDIAVMSTKGMSVTASRQLIEELCADHDIPLLVLHDFDISGFTIAGTLQESTRRYSFYRRFKVIDLGLRLADTDGLELEEVFFPDREDLDAKAQTLHRYGASAEEIDFLLTQRRRVELNAMTSPGFVEFLERKLTEKVSARSCRTGRRSNSPASAQPRSPTCRRLSGKSRRPQPTSLCPTTWSSNYNACSRNARNCPGTSRCSSWAATPRTRRKTRTSRKTRTRTIENGHFPAAEDGTFGTLF